MSANDRIAFVAKLMKRPVINPDILRELILPDETGATDEGGNAFKLHRLDCGVQSIRPASPLGQCALISSEFEIRILMTIYIDDILCR